MSRSVQRHLRFKDDFRAGLYQRCFSDFTQASGHHRSYGSKLGPSPARDGFKIQIQWKQVERDGKSVALADAWLYDQKYTNRKGVRLFTKLVILSGEIDYNGDCQADLSRKSGRQRALSQVFK